MLTTSASVQNISDVNLPAMLGEENILGLEIARMLEICMDDSIGGMLGLTAEPVQPNGSRYRAVKTGFREFLRVPIQHLSALYKIVNRML